MEDDAILEKLENGEMKIYAIETETKDANKAVELRRKFIEKKYGGPLEHIAKGSIDFNDALNRNVENPIGTVQVPLGFAGGLTVNGSHAKGVFPILLATTEGKLIAGVSRGISTLNKAGGAGVAVLKDGMTRDVLIRVANAAEASRIISWIDGREGREFLESAFSKSTKHGKMLGVRCYTTGRDIHIRFRAATGAAMGMNMVTIASNAAVEAMVPKVKEALNISVEIMSESGNMCSDKKPAYINMLEGRGVSVVADATIPRSLILERFKVEPELIAEVNRIKNFAGSALAGSHGFNAHVANMLAAMFLAHGQDIAQIVEGSQAMTEVSMKGEDLYVSVMLPALEVGTFGGGTRRETQKEALSLLKMYGENDETGTTRLAFAEVVAAVCLAGELNLIAAQAAHTLSKSHASLKR